MTSAQPVRPPAHPDSRTIVARALLRIFGLQRSAMDQLSLPASVVEEVGVLESERRELEAQAAEKCRRITELLGITPAGHRLG